MLFAYLDPGSGSLLLQAVLGGIAGVAVAFKAWKSRLFARKALRDERRVEKSDEDAMTTEP